MAHKPGFFGTTKQLTSLKGVNSRGKQLIHSLVPHQWSTARLMGLGGMVILLAVLWAYWTSLAEMASKWVHEPQYSHGYLVPVFAGILLWLRRDLLNGNQLEPSWWGLPILLAGVGLRYTGFHFYYEWLDFISLIPSLVGLCVLLGGWHALRWAWPAIGFLFFMIPLPYRLEVALRDPLRQLGTEASTYAMQTLGLAAVSEGNVIVLPDNRIGVAEACSGLRMLMVFFALSAGVVLLQSSRPLWQRGIILASAVPIALVSNVVRITVTGVLHVTVSSHLANTVFHDLGGWLMMPLALALLGGELWLLSRLVIVEEDRPMAVGLEPSQFALPSDEQAGDAQAAHSPVSGAVTEAPTASTRS